jgi:hypothetical protein
MSLVFPVVLLKSETWTGHKLQGRRKIHGLKVSIENRKGSTRSGVDKDGHEWSIKMHADYGRIRGSVGADGDLLDCYVGPNPESTRVFVIHQNDPTTGAYDEDKVMLGFDSPEEAKALYLKQYDRPGFFGSMEETDIDTFKEKAMAKKNHGKKLVIKKSIPQKLDGPFYAAFRAMFAGEDGSLDLYGNSYKLKDLDGFPAGLDLENCELIRYGEDVAFFQAGGDWQQGVNFAVGLKDGKLAIVSKFEDTQPQTRTERKAVAKQLIIKKSVEPIFGVEPELVVGIMVEKEHTDDPQEARKIAMDHLREDPHYYKKLIAAGLVDEPEALKAAQRLSLEKARKSPKLIPVVRTVTRDGTTFPMTVWMLPSDVKAGRLDTARQGDLFDVPMPMMQGDLFDQGPAAEIPAKVEAAKIELEALKGSADDEAKAQAVSLAAAETRNAVQAVFFGEPDAAGPTAPPAYEYSPETVGVEVMGGIHALDYTGVVPKAIGLLSPSRALDTARPSWVPEVSDSYFRKHDGRLPFIKLAENEYLVQVAGTSSRTSSSEDSAYAKVNLEVLAGLHDYYGKRAKAMTKKAIADDIAKKKAEAIQWLQEHPESLDENAYNKSTRWYYERAAKGEVKSRIKPFRTIGDNKASYDQYYLIQRAAGKATRSEVWAYFGEMMREYKQKTSDMEIQFEDNSSSFVKGRETSYGDSGTKATLLDQYGVRVKRQNGDEITDGEVADIRAALDSVFAAFGDRSSMARKYGLKISHSGDKLMHARRALGIYFPSYRAIGVTAQLGDKHMGFILAHEWAHFMDNYMGGELYHYASDKFGSPAHKIADTFRNAMMKPQKSDYQNRTCECFARAFEEYHSIKSGDEKTLQEYRQGQGNYVEPERFKATIAPLIEEFLKENNEILKSMRVWSFKL